MACRFFLTTILGGRLYPRLLCLQRPRESGRNDLHEHAEGPPGPARSRVAGRVVQRVVHASGRGVLTQQVDAAIAQSAELPGDRRARLERDLAQAKTELANVLDAIRQGLLTPATRQLLETCERHVAECAAALRVATQSQAPVTLLSRVIARYLSDLRATLSTDVEAARLLLARLLGSVTLRRVGTHMVAEIEGNVDAVLNREETCSDNPGAGSPSRSLPNLRGGYVVA